MTYGLTDSFRLGRNKGFRRDFYSRFSKLNQTIRRLAVVACLILGISSSLQADEVLYYYGSTLPGESMRPQSSDPQALCGIIANGQAYRGDRAELISFELVEVGRVIHDRTHFCRSIYEHSIAAFRNAGRVAHATNTIFRVFETDAANIHMCPTGDVVDHATDCPVLPPSTDQTVCAGNPIDFRGGIKRESKTDYLAGGAFPLLVRRYYSSEDHPLLDDWRFNYSTVGVRTLLIAPFGKLDTVWAASPNGAVLVYTSGEGNTYTATTDVIAQLVRLGNGWQFTDEDDNVATYDSSGKVAQVTTRQGLSHFYSYDDASVTITDDYGNKLIVNKNNNDEVISVTLPDNNRINYSYNFDGSYTFKEVLETVTYQDGRSVTYHYENPTNTSFLTGVTDERGVRYSTFGYDDNGRANSTEHTGGVDRYSFVYGDMDVAVTSPLGKVTEHTFENIQGSPKITRSDRLGSAFCGASSGSYTFDDNGYVNSKTDWEGNTTSFVRDNLGLVRSATQADGTTIERTVSTQWHTQFRLPEIITEPGQTTTYTYAPYNDPNYTQMHVTDISSGDTRTWSYTYDSVGRPLTIDGPRTDVSDITSYTYYNCSSGGACGQISTAVNALGHTTTFDAYNVHGQPTQITDSNGQVTTLSYNSRQWMTQVTVAGAVTTISYDAKGNITRVTQPDGAYLNSNWDDADRLTAVSDAEGNRVEWTLDAAGNRTDEITKDPGGQIRKSLNTSFDELSRVRAMVYAHGGTANYAYDNNSNLTTSTDPSNRVTSSNFDALDRLIKTIDPLLGETDYVYDDRDNLISVTDAEGLTTSYTYNGFDEPVIVRSPDTGTTTMNYDSAGNVVTQTDARGIQVSYSYDALNRVTQMSYPDAAKNVSYSYDQGANGTGRLTQIRDESGSTDFGYDARGNTTSVVYTIDGQSYAQSYTYNAADRLTGMTYPSGRSVSYGYDISARINQVTSVSDEGSEILASKITRLPFGPASGLTLGNGVSQSKTYDQDYRVLTIANDSVFEKGYAYNAVNNITAITDVLDTANSQLFSYDDLDRLEFAAGGYGDDDYSYDAIGNRLSTARDNQSENYQYSGGSHRLQGRGAINYSHDAVGNTLAGNGASFSYDDRNRMDSATTDGLTTTYTHNAMGQRVLKNVAGSQIHYVYDLDGRVIMEATGSGDVQVEYSYLDGEPLVMWREPTEVAGANLAQAGIASQSSTGFGGAASRAIDGNTSGAYRQGSVTHTNSEGQPWWEVSLAERSTISGVVLYNRTDGCCTARLTNVHVFVSEQPFGDQTLAELLARSDIAHAYLPGVQGSEVGVPITGAGSYVRVQLAGTGALSLAEVEVFGEPINAPLETNLSLSGAASQSSTGFGGAASRAIDGNTSGAYRQGSVTHTNNQSQPWWEVSLEERSTINAVKLYNRTDCCTSRLTNVHVFISEQPFGDQTLAELLARSDIAHAYLPGVQGSEVDVPITGAGSYVRVQLAGTGALSLAEVEVFGVPSLAPPDSNLSLSGVASQSSTGFAGAASRAIDGNTSGVYSQGSVTHTNNQSEPWWEVSLEERSTINGVSLYNRTDGCCTARLTNVHVFISEQPFGSQTLTELLARDDIAHAYLSGTQGSEIEVPIAGVGNYVRVQLAGTGVLSLAEVEVLGYGHSALGGQ